MKSPKIQLYSAQAIAIVMVVLVVAAVLGASLYSRTINNQRSVTNQQDSDISLEQADTILNMFLEADIDKLSTLTKGEPKVYTSMSTLLADPNIGLTANAKKIVEGLTNDPNNPSTQLCEGGTGDASGIKVTLSRVAPSESVDVSVGDSRNFNFDGPPVDTGDLILTVKGNGNPNAVFAIKKIYKNQGTGDYKAYDKDDNKVYCLTADCGGLVDPIGSANIVSGNILVSLSPSDGYNIYQIRVIPLVGDITVSYSTAVPNINFGYIKINAAVNCYGSYREKEMIIPSTESLGYPTTFDYVLYNNGILSTN